MRLQVPREVFGEFVVVALFLSRLGTPLLEWFQRETKRKLTTLFWSPILSQRDVLVFWVVLKGGTG